MPIRIHHGLTRRRLLATAASATALSAAGSIARPYLSFAADRPLVTHGVQSGDVSVDGGTCATVGVLGTAVAVLGSLQAHLALHLLLGLEPSVLGRVITFDAKRLAFGGFGFAGSPEPERFVPFIAPTAVTADDLVVDLRSLEEAPQSPFAGARRLDVDGVATLLTEPPSSRRIVLCCRSGQRSLAAADRLREGGLDNLALVALG